MGKFRGLPSLGNSMADRGNGQIAIERWQCIDLTCNFNSIDGKGVGVAIQQEWRRRRKVRLFSSSHLRRIVLGSREDNDHDLRVDCWYFTAARNVFVRVSHLKVRYREWTCEKKRFLRGCASLIQRKEPLNDAFLSFMAIVMILVALISRWST